MGCYSGLINQKNYLLEFHQIDIDRYYTLQDSAEFANNWGEGMGGKGFLSSLLCEGPILATSPALMQLQCSPVVREQMLL